MATLNVVDQRQKEFIELIRSMFSRVDWLVPFVEAQDQYRSAYYGMTAAALLEDFFVDALANFANRFRPAVAIERPQRGAAGMVGDYLVDGLAISHKNLLGPEDLAVHWDATVSNLDHWSSATPIMILTSRHSHKMGFAATTGGEDLGQARVGYDLPSSLRQSFVWAVVEWSEKQVAKVVTVTDSQPGSWDEVWRLLGEVVERADSPNLIDLVLLPEGVEEGKHYRLEIGVRPGAYLIPVELLADIQLTRNNRGRLIPKRTVMELMARSANLEFWVPLPTWPGTFAGPRPPDLFLPQHTGFTGRFSPVQLAKFGSGSA